MVYYRKYRPQKIEELDSSEVRELLFSVLSSEDIAHAFLFTGPKGLGKTSAARIVAKAVNCKKKSKINPSTSSGQKSKMSPVGRQVKSQNLGNEIEPCNECDQCVSITNGTNIDVLEIDGASNRGIDEVRDLREKIRLAPAYATKKVYIIDEVHMLTTEAFNALLKTIEEPPPHVIFVLCTTEPHKVPATIVSRCFHISFRKAGREELVRSFERIAEKENLIIEKEVLNSIASFSDGSFRDGAKILEEMAAFSKTITKDLIEQKYKIRHLTEQIDKMIKFLSTKDTKGGLGLVGELVKDSVDMKFFLEQLILQFHRILLVEIGVIKDSELRIYSSELRAAEIKELVELLSKAYGELKYAVLPQLPLELAIVEWGIQNQSQLGQKIQNQTAKASSPSGEGNFWQELIDRVKAYNHSVAGVLRGCRFKEYDGKKLIIETGYSFHKDRLDDKTSVAILKKVGREIFGKTIDIDILLREKKRR